MTFGLDGRNLRSIHRDLIDKSAIFSTLNAVLPYFHRDAKKEE